MATTSNTYTGDGSTTLFSFTFPYISTSDVKVQLDGTASTQFSFSNATTLALTTAPASGVIVTIFRDTNIEDVTSAFYAGSSIKAKDLNDNFIQTLYVSQEVNNTSLNTLGGTMIGELNMSNQKIVSLGTPTAATDASTRGYVDAVVVSQQAQVDAAVASATAAASSASSSVTSASSSATSATNSATSATASATSATASATSATASAGSATTATTQATDASNSSTTAANFASSATTSAANALLYATNSATSSGTSAGHANNAAASATTATVAQQGASNMAMAAASSAAAALAAFDDFDDTYLGSKASDPSTDNDGDALTAGALYFNTTTDVMRLYTGSAWVTVFVPGEAVNISFTAAGDLAGTNVQTAIQELDTEKVPRTSTTGSANIPNGTTAQRDGSPAGGMIRYNTTTASFEGYTTGWGSLGSGPLLKTNRLENTTTTDGGIDIDSSGHVKLDGLQMPTAGALSNRNLITNGSMQVSQRGTSLANTADGTYLVDRFKLYDSAANTHTLTQSQSSNVPNFSNGETGFSKSLRVEVTYGQTTPTTGYTVIAQPIEGFDAAQLQYGTANAKTVTLSFWARTNVPGNYSVALRNSAADYSYIAQFAHMGSDSWFKQKITIPGATAGTWLTDNGKGLEVLWTLDAGSNWNGTEDAWNTSNLFNLGANTNNFSDTTGNYFEITGVQLEVGSKTTEYEHKSYSETLAKCQRYFEGVPAGSTFNQGDAIDWSGYALLNGINYATKAFTVEKRTIPTIVMTNNSVIAGFNAATCQVAVAGTRGIRGNATATGTVGARYFFLHFTADAEL
jgi:hypothetical protein